LSAVRPRIPAALAFAALAAAPIASAQAPRPADVPSLPETGRLLARVETGWYRPSAFVSSEGDAQDFFEHPDFFLGTLRVSYSPLSRFAVGLELPYRYTRLPVPGASALTAMGVPGAGIFVDWAPLESPRLTSALRVEYFRSRGAGEEPVTITDGSDRYCLDAAVFLRPAADRTWTGGAHTGARYVPNADSGESGPEQSGSFVDWEVDLRFGPRIARLGEANLALLALGGYALSTASHQEGLVLHDLKARRAFAGAVLQTDWRKGAQAAPDLALTVERDFAARNSLSGWRLTLAWTGQF
jgi:hypothetical protein